MRLAPAVLAVVIAACASLPGMTVPLASNNWGEYSLAVHDASGLVASVRGVDAEPADRDGVVVLPERREIELRWTGGACSHRPVVTVEGTPRDLSIVVSNPHDPQPLPFLPVGCPAVGVPLGAILSLSRPVEDDAIRLEVTY